MPGPPGACGMVSASGGYRSATTCQPPGGMVVDWIFGSPETTFSEYQVNRGPRVRKSTDHPMIIAEAELPPIPPTDCPTPTPTPTPPPVTGTPSPNVPGSS